MLIGARSSDEMNEAQRAVYAAIASGPRGSVPHPFLAMLDAPGLAETIGAVGAAIRFAGEASAAVREIAILATAASFGSGYEWDYHAPVARASGVPEPVVVATTTGIVSALADPVAALVIALCRAAVTERTIDPAHLAPLVEAIGRPAASEVVAICGYYQMLALFLSAAGLDHPAAYRPSQPAA